MDIGTIGHWGKVVGDRVFSGDKDNPVEVSRNPNIRDLYGEDLYADPRFANVANAAFSDSTVHVRANQRDAPFPGQTTEDELQSHRLKVAADTITAAAVRIEKAATDLQMKTDPDIPGRWKDRWT